MTLKTMTRMMLRHNKFAINLMCAGSVAEGQQEGRSCGQMRMGLNIHSPQNTRCGTICMWHIQPDLHDDYFNKKFQIRFCLPYPQFIELVKALETEDSFRRWHEGNMSYKMKESTPISLLVLCALRYVGRGWTFDDLSQRIQLSVLK